MPNLLRRPSPFLLAAAIAALCVLALPAASAGARSAATADRSSHGGQAQDFERFLHRYEAANTAFVNGNPSPWLSITAAKDPVSIFGGFGGLGEAGLASVFQRYLLAATAFQSSGAKVEFQYLVKDVQGRLAYTVAIERSNVLYAGQTETQPQILRVTMLFRREHGAWKIVHRHADTMIDLQLPTASSPPAR
jgi:SnoaL-like domain